MILRRRIGTILLVLVLPVATAAQESTSQDPILRRAAEMYESQGPAQALGLLESAAARGELSPAGQAMYGSLLLEAGRVTQAYEILEPLSRNEMAPPGLLFDTWRAASMIGRGEERVDLLERAATRDPASPAARQLGLIRGSEGNLQDAYRYLAGWARLHAEDTEARLAAAHAALELRRVPQAEELLAGLSVDVPQVRLLRGQAHFLRGEPVKALEVLEGFGTGAGLHPRLDRDRRLMMANAYIDIGEAQSAVDLLRGRAANDPGITLALARAQSQTGAMAESLATIAPLAEAVLSDRAAFDTDLSVAALLSYGRQLIATGSHAKAVAPLTIVTELNENDKSAWYALGQALAVSGHREEAREALARFDELTRIESSRMESQNTAERDIDDPTGRELRRAIYLHRDGKGDEALEVVRAERRLAPGDPRGAMIEAQILRGLGRLSEALRAAQEAVDLAPSSADSYYQRASVLTASGRLDEAETDFGKALEIDPRHLTSLNDLAVLLITRDRREEARDLLQRALSIDPQDEIAAKNLATLDPP